MSHFSVAIKKEKTLGILTVNRFALSKYPVFEPAKMQSIERMKAVRERIRGTSAVRRSLFMKSLKAITAQQFAEVKD